MAEKSPAAEIDTPNGASKLGIMLGCQHRAWEPDFLHVARGGLIDRQKTHSGTERPFAPAFHTFVENRIGFAGFDMFPAHRAAWVRRFENFAAPALDLSKARPVSFEDLFDCIDGGLKLHPAAGGYAQRVFLLDHVLQGLDAGFFAHGENQSVPGWKYADGPERNFLFIKTASQISHRRKADGIAEAEVIFFSTYEQRRAGAAELRIAPAHGDMELRFGRQLDIIKKSESEEVGDIDALRGGADGKLYRFIHKETRSVRRPRSVITALRRISPLIYLSFFGGRP